jgi:hypothetical protein
VSTLGSEEALMLLQREFLGDVALVHGRQQQGQRLGPNVVRSDEFHGVDGVVVEAGVLGGPVDHRDRRLLCGARVTHRRHRFDRDRDATGFDGLRGEDPGPGEVGIL